MRSAHALYWEAINSINLITKPASSNSKNLSKAIEAVARDPAQALQVARESLAKGLTFEVLHLLDRLNQKDSEKASEFAGEIIAKLRTINVAIDFRATLVAVQLLEVSRVPDADRPTSRPGNARKILDFLDGEEIGIAAYRKKLDHLKSMLPKIRRKEERARAMAEVALMLKEKGEDAEASSLLDEAASLVKTDLKSETKTNALLTLLCAYAVVEPAKAFALAERTVDQANSQISLLMLIDRVVKSGAVKKSEIILDQAGIMPLDFLVFRYGKGVAALARADFDRTRALADRFDRQELRVLARLLIVKGILTPEQTNQ